MIQELGFFRFFINAPFKLPAKTFRNILIGFISFSIYMYIYREVMLTDNQMLILLLVLFAPFISFSIVSIGVIITSVLTNIKRRQIILKAKQKVEKSKTVFIGITGSYGKTTTKELLFNLLSTSFNAAKTDKNMNTDVGVALSILKNLNPDTEFFITEMGAYRRGEIKTICDFVKPTYGIITGIGNQHLALFGSIDNIIKTKAELLNSLPKNGKAYVSKDKGFDYFQNQATYPIISFGSSHADITIKKILNDKIPTYKIEYKQNRFFLNTQIPSQFLTNLLPVITLSIDLGVSLKIISQKIPAIINDLYNQLVKVTKQGMKIIDTSYNVNVEGFIGIIELLQSFKTTNNIVISKGIIELGDDKESSYKRIIAKLDISQAVLYTTDAIFYQLRNKENIMFFNNEESMISKIATYKPNETSLTIVGRVSQKFRNKILNLL